MKRIQLPVWLFVVLLFVSATARAGGDALSNFEDASVVIGQSDFITGGCGSAAANTICDPYNAVATTKQVFISDADNSRVLGFKGVPTTNGASAKFVLGQANFSGTNRAVGKAAFSFPTAVAVGGGKLFVNDFDNSRVLIWNKLPTKTHKPANVVLGQKNFNSTTAGAGQSGLDNPETGLAVAGGKLFVADRNNNRIMIWNKIPKSSGAPASVVVGQPDFNAIDPATSQTGLNEPEGLWSDGTRLVVADFMNNRVLIWNSIPTSNGGAADVVVGQADFTSSDSPSPPTSQSLSRPFGVVSDGTRLFVADTDNNRVLVYSPFPTANNPAASIVLGQPDFVHGDSNAGNLNPAANTFAQPYGLSISGSQLFVADFDNARILIFGL